MLAAVRLPADTPAWSRSRGVTPTAATEVPLAIAAASAEIAALAAEGNPNLAGDARDARAAVVLAEGARLDELVRINVRHGGLDGALLDAAEDRVRRAAAHL